MLTPTYNNMQRGWFGLFAGPMAILIAIREEGTGWPARVSNSWMRLFGALSDLKKSHARMREVAL